MLAATVVPGRQGNFKVIHAAPILMGRAELGEQPGPAVLKACWSAVEREGPSNAQAVANALWAVLEVRAVCSFLCLFCAQ